MKKPFRIAGVYDTETTNHKQDDRWSAFCCLYILNDIRDVDLRSYEPGCAHEHITFGRYEDDFHSYIAEMVAWGRAGGVIPIICAYNLMFDLQTVRYRLNREYRIESTAQSATNVYTVDLYDGDEHVLRFWDTYHLEMNGLSAMGRTAGVAKLEGEWDYSLIRTPETELTEEELSYAARDVQVIPAYLRYLLEANAWLESDMLGHSVLTKTSIVRQMAKKDIGKLKFRNAHGKKVPLLWAFQRTCAQEMPRGFYDHAIRLACFRGGLTFTSARYASRTVHNVASLDVVSMHHAYITGRYVPVRFTRKSPYNLQALAKDVLHTPLDEVLAHYDKPFSCGLHIRIRFTNIRLRAGSAFGAWHIGLLAEGKFKSSSEKGFGTNERSRIADAANRSSGWVDWAYKPVFAFGKLMCAQECVVHVSELELWNIGQVYEWDDMEVILGEGTLKFVRPPDYVTLQSCLLFEQKNAAKKISHAYHEDEPYTDAIAETIPTGITEQLRKGEIRESFLESWYNSTVKGMFNGIYGTQAQNVYKPDYAVSAGEWSVNHATIVTHDNWDEMRKEESMVLYPYGMRIVGGSRMHLVIAIRMLYEAFGENIAITGGDTDSLKIALGSVSSDEVMDALAPLHVSIRAAIDRVMDKPRKEHPKFASSLSHIGEFELEDIYDEHYEAWNKARVSRKDGRCHVTCAGLSRPQDEYTIEDWLDDRCEIIGFDKAVEEAIGYNSEIAHDVSHSLQRTHPSAVDMFDDMVTDHLGATCHVRSHEAIALYASVRELGGTEKRANAENITYLKREFDYAPDTEMRIITRKDGMAVCERVDEIL